MAPPPLPDASLRFLSVAGCASDFLVVAGSGKTKAEFPAHRAVLACASPFFAAAAGSTFKEGISGRCELPEDDASTVKLLLRWIYRDAAFAFVQLKPKELHSMLTLGDKLGIERLPEEADRALLGPVLQRMFTTELGELFAVAAGADLAKTVAATKVKLLEAPQDVFEEVLDLVTAVKPSLACELAVERMKEMKSAMADVAVGTAKEKLAKFLAKPPPKRHRANFTDIESDDEIRPIPNRFRARQIRTPGADDN